MVNNAFELWNNKDHPRRLHEMQLLADVSDEYQPLKQIRSVPKRSLSFANPEMMYKKPKGQTSNAIKCKLQIYILNIVESFLRCKWM